MYIQYRSGGYQNYNMYLLETAAGDKPMLCEDCRLLHIISQSDTVHLPQVSMMVLDVKR